MSDGATAWARLEKSGIRVVVSDWRMLGMDGLDLCRMIRKREGEYVYFILISAQKITKENRHSGLAICWKIIEGHGGFICVENRPEGGCSFKFSIPQSV